VQQRERLAAQLTDVDLDTGSLRNLRRAGVSLCSRQSREQKLQQMQAAEAAKARALLETPERVEAAAGGARGSVSAHGLAKGSAGGAASGTGQEGPAKRPRKSEDAKRKALPRVEVGLRERGFASWYLALSLQESKSRTKVRLLKQDEEDLHIEGRPAEELVSTEYVRPVPPRIDKWVPSINERCELYYLDGWWPVKVKKAVGEKWKVLYEEYKQSISHTVTRDLLRPALAFNPDSRAFVPAAKLGK